MRCRTVRLASVLAVLFLVGSTRVFSQTEFVRGDVNFDGLVTISDAQVWNCILFCLSWPIACEDAADADDNGRIDIADLVRTLTAAFLGSELKRGDSVIIPPPFPDPGPDPTPDDLGCENVPFEPTAQRGDQISLGSVRAGVGSTVSIPVRVTTDREIHGIQITVRYDASRFNPFDDSRLSSSERVAAFIAGTIFEEPRYRLRSPFFSSRVFAEDGIVVLALECSLVGFESAPAGEDVHVLNLLGTTAEELAVGDVVSLDLVEFRSEDGFVYRNEISSELGGALVEETSGAEVSIVELFVRGDANIDGRLDISDAIDVLGNLFVGGVLINCRDSADYDDDAAISIGDAVGLLTYLFRGGPAPTRPFPGCGVDPSADSLGCASYPPCP